MVVRRSALCVALAIGLVACASDPNDVPGAVVVQPTGVVVRVQAQDNLFRNPVTKVHVGDTVRWTNVGHNDHDVIPKDGDLSWGVLVDAFHPKDTYEHIFSAPGMYEYFCSIHGTNAKGMVGTIIVTA